jgi:hypothetical protein
MIPADKLLKLADSLLERSRRDEVRWIAEPEQKTPAQRTSWRRVLFPKYVLRVGKICPAAGDDYYELRVESVDNGHLISSVRSDDYIQDPLAHTQFSDLFDEADRCVTGWDRVYAELEAAVKREGPVGVLQNQ